MGAHPAREPRSPARDTDRPTPNREFDKDRQCYRALFGKEREQIEEPSACRGSDGGLATDPKCDQHEQCDEDLGATHDAGDRFNTDRVHRENGCGNESRGRGTEQFAGKEEQDERCDGVERDVRDVKSRRAQPGKLVVEGVAKDGERPIQPRIYRIAGRPSACPVIGCEDPRQTPD